MILQRVYSTACQRSRHSISVRSKSFLSRSFCKPKRETLAFSTSKKVSSESVTNSPDQPNPAASSSSATSSSSTASSSSPSNPKATAAPSVLKHPCDPSPESASPSLNGPETSCDGEPVPSSNIGLPSKACQSSPSPTSDSSSSNSDNLLAHPSHPSSESDTVVIPESAHQWSLRDSKVLNAVSSVPWWNSDYGFASFEPRRQRAPVTRQRAPSAPPAPASLSESEFSNLQHLVLSNLWLYVPPIPASYQAQAASEVREAVSDAQSSESASESSLLHEDDSHAHTYSTESDQGHQMISMIKRRRKKMKTHKRKKRLRKIRQKARK